MIRYLAPLGIFVAMAVFFFIGLGKDPQKLPSVLVDKPVPQFTLPKLKAANASFSPEDMKGQVWMLNVWASWCDACRSEHPLFLDIARKKELPIIGLNYKDEPNDAINWLRQLGDPYTASASDFKGDVGIDFGVYGVPESFIIDKAGVIRYKHVGPVSPQDWEQKMRPLIKELQG
ncbi:MAG: DsbE family thiol:disulfide interchange protein [Gammaproteobacteria bacterium]|nr:DsbE family thiol:disulfide interchange protein [Gammaproteobacteria bacterium]MDH5693072.1 DsbE family thiol:disulfide interchange protein [Gammaproteobacteria bacterium]